MITKEITKSVTKLRECDEILGNLLSLCVRSVEDNDNFEQDCQEIKESKKIIFQIQSHMGKIDRIIFELLNTKNSIENYSKEYNPTCIWSCGDINLAGRNNEYSKTTQRQVVETYKVYNSREPEYPDYFVDKKGKINYVEIWCV